MRAGIHKKTGKRVAIKVMKKAVMTPQDVELVKLEIEIMKMCQHPNLIRMLDVFENTEHMYIVMELLEGGDLFAYLEKRKFRVPEQRASSIIHSLAAGIYYLHTYGIVHRDLKPENILMVDKTETSDVKIVDFGLSKMIGPSQLCNEPFGTLSYVAPEVLLQKPYGKAVDVWSVGIVAFLMLVASLPFDHEDDKEVARYLSSLIFFVSLTIYSEPDYNTSAWKRISKEGVDFVKSTPSISILSLARTPSEGSRQKTLVERGPGTPLDHPRYQRRPESPSQLPSEQRLPALRTSPARHL